VTSHRLLLLGLVTATVGNALVAGVFLAFNSFVMPALARIAPESGVSAMQSINIVVVRSLFIAIYLASTVVSAALILTPMFRLSGATAWFVCAAGVISVAGSFGVTMWLNVPLNDALAAATPGTQPAAELWPAYLRDWGSANFARMVASATACALFFGASLRLVSES
jgi:uncharacterized membrane protein